MAPSLRTWVQDVLSRFSGVEDRLDRMQQALGRMELQLQTLRGSTDPAEREFQVTSQWGEDGIIQALVASMPLGRRRFVEFGVEDYRESNTRFLLRHDNWSGLVIDGAEANVERIRRDAISWRHDLVSRCAFVTRENIDELLRADGFDGDLDLLSIDIDGNDYWVWRAITVTKPRIVIVEYNSVFGPDISCSIPYRSDFQRTESHPSNLYYGASVAAFERLGKELGYRLVCGNRAGNNLFFVREDLAGTLPRRTAAEAWVESRFREARDKSGALLLRRADQERQLIETLPVVDTATGREQSLAALLAAR